MRSTRKSLIDLSQTRPIPFYESPAQCGYSGAETPDDHYYINVPEVFLTGIVRPIAHRVQGNSMYPRYKDGMLVILETDEGVISEQLCSGKYIVANVNGTAMCKRYMLQQNDQVWLFSLNKSYEDIFIGRFDFFKVIGIVKKRLVDDEDEE